ncbi:hypothetical protein Tco_1051524, partial [Tanacetum coccineum]
MRERRRQACNERVHVELEYSNEEYDEEIETEPRPSNLIFANETTHAMRTEDVRDRIISRIEMRLDERRRRDNNTRTGIGEGQGVNLPSLSQPILAGMKLGNHRIHLSPLVTKALSLRLIKEGILILML